MAKALRTSGLKLPELTVMSNSIPLRNRLLATGRYWSMIPYSMLKLGSEHPPVRILPIKLPKIARPVELITLKNRMLSPTANRFIECARRVAKSRLRSAD
jgi:DNA-binding transcriptional LysR family regulator